MKLFLFADDTKILQVLFSAIYYQVQRSNTPCAPSDLINGNYNLIPQNVK